MYHITLFFCQFRNWMGSFATQVCSHCVCPLALVSAFKFKNKKIHQASETTIYIYCKGIHQIPACPLGKQLSQFAYLGPLLAHLS